MHVESGNGGNVEGGANGGKRFVMYVSENEEKPLAVRQ